MHQRQWTGSLPWTPSTRSARAIDFPIKTDSATELSRNIVVPATAAVINTRSPLVALDVVELGTESTEFAMEVPARLGGNWRWSGLLRGLCSDAYARSESAGSRRRILHGGSASRDGVDGLHDNEGGDGEGEHCDGDDERGNEHGVHGICPFGGA